MLTIKELADQSGLTENVIRKYLRLLGSFLRPYIKRGKANKLLFDPNCVVICQEIKKQKDEGKTSKEITRFFTEECPASTRKITYQKIGSGQTDQTVQTQQIQELYQQLLAEKDRRISEVDKRDVRIVRLELKNGKLQESLKQLPSVQKYTRIREELELARENDQAINNILVELKDCPWFHCFKRQRIVRSLADMV